MQTDFFDDSTERGGRFVLVVEFDQEEDILGEDAMYAQLAASSAVVILRESMKVNRVELIDRCVVPQDPTLTLCE